MSPHASLFLTGTTGGLGASILTHLLSSSNTTLPRSSIIATSRSASKRARFEAQGIQFRVADYDRRDTLVAAFAGVHDVLFVSSPTRYTAQRNAEHRNVVQAAKTARVGRVWYFSLAFGGWTDESEVVFQQAHYETEAMLKASGLDFISLRAGLYADAFPMFLNYYPSTTAVQFPLISPPVTANGLAFASRDELGEGMATLLARGLDAFPSIEPRTAKNIILLTGPKAETLLDLVGAIDRGRGEGPQMGVGWVEEQTWIDSAARKDEGGKGRGWFESRLLFMKGVAGGDAATVDPALEVLLGRRPESGTEMTERLIRTDRGYTWHQNYVNNLS